MRQALILLLHCTKDTVKFGDKDLSHDHDMNLTSCTKAEHTIHIKNNTVPLLPYTKYYRTPNDLPRVLLTFGSTKVSMNPELFPVLPGGVDSSASPRFVVTSPDLRGRVASPTSVAVLISAIALWYLFERAGYNSCPSSPMSCCFSLLFFFWAKAANLLNRPLPPLLGLEILEETIARVVDALQIWLNLALSVAHDIAIEKNFLLCLQVVGVLWVISYIDSLFNFLTLIYIGVLLRLSLLVLYDKNQNNFNFHG
ncbi:Reticulon-like protein B11 [Glycine soja]|uniref:Reticulon-like protein n=1 Tax=Glycine soja TaxID=3848 RepID=A0A445LWR6_GLYSO|nr:Reticulon-like protein B11 [Glycine soja]